MTLPPNEKEYPRTVTTFTGNKKKLSQKMIKTSVIS